MLLIQKFFHNHSYLVLLIFVQLHFRLMCHFLRYHVNLLNYFLVLHLHLSQIFPHHLQQELQKFELLHIYMLRLKPYKQTIHLCQNLLQQHLHQYIHFVLLNLILHHNYNIITSLNNLLDFLWYYNYFLFNHCLSCFCNNCF